MKKIFAIIAIAASMFAVNAQAQPKNAAAAKAAVDKAQAAVENDKQNTKFATWLKYGETLVNAYNIPAGNVWLGMSQQDVQVLSTGAGERLVSDSQVMVGDQPMRKLSYANKDLYFNNAGQLAIIDVTKPIVENALDKALDAYAKAAQLDTKGQKTADIKKALESIASKYAEDAYNAYSLNRMKVASDLFEKAVKASGTAPLSVVDTNNIYNAGTTAWATQDWNRAKSLFDKCYNYGYFNKGETFAKLSDVSDKLGDKAAAKKYLEEGAAKFPESESLMIGLINYYMNNDENSDELFNLFKKAQSADPTNASLYYAEGKARANMGQDTEAIAAYDKAIEINPNYEWGYIGKGIKLYEMAVDIQDKASQEPDDAKYMALMGEFEKTLKACIPAFEKGFELVKDPELQKSIAEYLKNACFRFRSEGGDFQAKYEKYNAVLNG